MKWFIGQFALLQGQIVQITRIPHSKRSFSSNTNRPIQIKLLKDNLLHWVEVQQLQQLKGQLAVKVLYS